MEGFVRRVGWTLCNDNRIDDRDRCQAAECLLLRECGRRALNGKHAIAVQSLRRSSLLRVDRSVPARKA
jgi:hypothetical protein